MPLDLDKLATDPGFKPRDWQIAAPRETWGSAPPVMDSSELRRVLALPRRPPEEDGTERAAALVQLITDRYSREPGPCRCAEIDPGAECILELRFVQAWALREIAIAGGLVGSIATGAGKTVIDILSILALEAYGVKLGLLLVPPSLLSQLVGDYIFIGQHFRVPSIIVHGGDGYQHVVSGAPLLHVLPYSQLSRPSSTRWIEDLRPEVIIADECQKLRDADTATTSRVLRYFDARPDTRFCGWTGTLTDKSLHDYAHISGMALKHLSPLPRGPTGPDVVGDWCRALDPKGVSCDPGALWAMCEPGEHLASGYRRRLTETCGIVATTESSIDAELVVEERVPETVADLARLGERSLPEEVRQALEVVRGGERPDGDPLLDALQVAKCAREVASGFYYYWHFPGEPPVSLVLEWMEKRKRWRKELRTQLAERAEHMDSEGLCKHAAQRFWGDRPKRKDLPEWESEHWPAWRDIENRIVHETRARRISDYLARDAARWALEHRGIVWYEHTEFGAMVSQISGLPMYAGGAMGGGLIDRQGRIVERGDRSLILSIKAHGTGRNGLQRVFSEMLFGNPPSNPTMWEQAIARLHRLGQPSNIIRAWFYRHTKELRKAMQGALRAARYVQGTLGANQKLLSGYSGDDDVAEEEVEE